MRSRIHMGRGSGRSVAGGIVVVVAMMQVTCTPDVQLQTNSVTKQRPVTCKTTQFTLRANASRQNHTSHLT